MTYHTIERWRIDVPNVVEQVTIRAQLTDDHDRRLASVLRDAYPQLDVPLQHNAQEERLTDTYEFHDVRMVKVAKELQLLDVHYKACVSRDFKSNTISTYSQ